MGIVALMLLVVFRLIARWPLPLLHGLGRAAGRLVYAWPGRYRRRLQANAAQAGYIDPAFARRSAAETGAMIMETPKVWLRNQECLRMTRSDDDAVVHQALAEGRRSEEHTSELQSLMRISYAVFCLKQKK